jgi:hypothetical protein
VLTLSIIHDPAFIVSAALWSATLVAAAVFVETAPACTLSDIIDFKDFSSSTVKLATIAFAVAVISVTLNVSPLLEVALVFQGAILVYELSAFIDYLIRFRKNWCCSPPLTYRSYRRARKHIREVSGSGQADC